MEKSFREMKLLTAAEVADIVRLNHQVVLRKLKTGEIAAYKIGKEWRVEESALREWLDRHSNRRSEQDKVLQNFFDDEDKLKSIPTKRSKRIYVLERLLEEFDFDKTYSEKEVNQILRQFHSDVCTLRREFIMNNMMVRKDGLYHRCTSHYRKTISKK